MFWELKFVEEWRKENRLKIGVSSATPGRISQSPDICLVGGIFVRLYRLYIYQHCRSLEQRIWRNVYLKLKLNHIHLILFALLLFNCVNRDYFPVTRDVTTYVTEKFPLQNQFVSDSWTVLGYVSINLMWVTLHINSILFALEMFSTDW